MSEAARRPPRTQRGRLLGVVGALLVAAAVGVLCYSSALRASEAEETDDVLSRLEALLPAGGGAGVADDVAEGERTPSFLIADVPYMGVLSVPSVELELPVRTTGDSGSLQVAPYCYAGSPAGRLVLVGWDSDRQFGKLSRVGVGDHVRFVDTGGAGYSYHVNSLTRPQDLGSPDEAVGADLALCAYDSSSGAYLVVLASRD